MHNELCAFFMGKEYLIISKVCSTGKIWQLGQSVLTWLRQNMIQNNCEIMSVCIFICTSCSHFFFMEKTWRKKKLLKDLCYWEVIYCLWFQHVTNCAFNFFSFVYKFIIRSSYPAGVYTNIVALLCSGTSFYSLVIESINTYTIQS